MVDYLIEINGLKISFKQKNGFVQVVRGIDLKIKRGEIVGILGESGCGKTVSATSILRLEDESAIYDSGQIFFKGKELTNLPESEYQEIRGNQIAYIFQNASTALIPHKKIGKQLMGVLKRHDLPRSKEKILETLESVGITEAETVYEMYPFQLSGGQNQRIMIAQGIICGPDLLIADEPTSSVDVALRKVILDMLKEINRKTGMAILLITHDFEVINYICDRVVVMYGGLIMEEGPMAEVMSNPLHPYTKALTYCAQSIYQNGSDLFTLSGAPPTPAEFKLECPFAPRCSFKRSTCMLEMPMMMEVDDRKVRCVLYREEYPDVRSDL